MEQQPLFDLQQYMSQSDEPEPSNVFVEYMGEEAAEKIISCLGGQDLRVPVIETGPVYAGLLEKLGQELTAEFMRIFGGEMIYVPLEYSCRLENRNKQIRERINELVMQGKSSATAMQIAAEEFELSQRSVRRIHSQ